MIKAAEQRSKMQTLRGPADPLRDTGPWSLNLRAGTLELYWDDLMPIRENFQAFFDHPKAIMRLFKEILK